MSVNEKMTAIADEIRALSGTTEAMGLDAMATNVNGANTEVNSQTDLIGQIMTALETKTAPSQGVELPTLTNEGSASDLLEGKQFIETCTMTFKNTHSNIQIIGTIINENGEIGYVDGIISDESVFNGLKNNIICFVSNDWHYDLPNTVAKGATQNAFYLQNGMVTFLLTNDQAEFEFVTY